MAGNRRAKKVLSLILKVALPLVVTVGLCIVLFTGIDFKEMMEIIRRDCDFRWLGLMIVISIASHVFRAMRWQIQLKALNVSPPLFWTVVSIFGTYAVNLVFPRLGEFWRTGYIAARQKAPFTTVFGSMLADRLTDILTVIVLTIVTFILASHAIIAFLTRYPEVYNGLIGFIESPLLWCLIFFVTVGAWLLFFKRTDNSLIKKIREWAHDLWKGFAIVIKMKGKIRWMLLTIGIWGCYFFQLYVCFFAFSFTTEIIHQHGVIAALVCFVLSSIAMGIPSNGGIGPWQMATVFALSIYAPVGLTASAAESFHLESIAFANLVLGTETLLIIALGLFAFVSILIDRRRSGSTNKVNG